MFLKSLNIPLILEALLDMILALLYITDELSWGDCIFYCKTILLSIEYDQNKNIGLNDNNNIHDIA